MDDLSLDLTLDLTDAPADADVRTVGLGLRGFNVAALGESGRRPLAVFARGGDGEVRGGLVGDTAYGWLHVDLLWLEEELRGQGWGARLLAAAEREAVARGCARAYLDTATFQAPEFYLRHGYAEVGRLDGFRSGHDIVYLAKDLARPDAPTAEEP